MPIIRFESSAALADEAQALDVRHSQGWTGESREQCFERARCGNDALVPKAQEMLDQIDATGLDLARAEWVNDVAGALADVPAFLAGHHASMKAKRVLRDDRAPIRIFTDLTSSAMIDHSVLAKRGTAMLALTMALSQARPVECFAVVALNHNKGKGAAIAVVTIPAAPLELSTACHVLTSASFARSLGYGVLMHKLNSGGGWAWNIDPFGSSRERFILSMRSALGMTPADIYLPPPHYDQHSEPIIKDPIRWINDELRKAGALMEESA